MSRHRDDEDRDEELRELRLKHAKTIERSAKLLVELEASNESDRAVQRAAKVADLLPDPDKTDSD